MLARAATAVVSAAGPAVPALFRPRPSVLRALRAGTAATMATKAKGPTIKTRRDFVYYPDEALQLLKLSATAKFDESIDIAIQMGVDPRKAGENLRGVAQLPAGTGKTVRIAVFARGDKAEEARAAGADIVGAEELVELVQSGALQADKVIATPDVMPLVGRVGRILGPRGLMPNPKLGTVTMDVTSAVTNARKGQVSFRVEKQAIIHAPLGRVSFSDEAILSNLRALVLAINALKPEGFKGDFFRHATLSSTMGPGVHIDVTTIDPARARFGHTSGQYRDPKLEELGSAVKVDAVALMARHRRGEPVRA